MNMLGVDPPFEEDFLSIEAFNTDNTSAEVY